MFAEAIGRVREEVSFVITWITHDRMTAEFLAAIEGKGAPRCDGNSGLRVVEALAAAQQSLEQGGAPVTLD